MSTVDIMTINILIVDILMASHKNPPFFGDNW